MALSPTLWRTCRVLSGGTRLALLRRVIKHPGLSVSELAAAEKIDLARASQELRRLQARGIVGVEREGRRVRYFPEPDPLVASAKPLLRALQEACAKYPPAGDEQTARIAQGLAHERRIAVVRALRAEPRSFLVLQGAVQIPGQTLWHHLRLLAAGGWVEQDGRTWKLAEADHPLAKCLLKLL